jgi:MFS family permease
MRMGDDATVKRVTLVACILGSGIALLDGTVVNVALPTIQRALGGGLAAQQWVVNGYLLTLGSLILVGGSRGDLYGERRVFALGVSGFGAASLICALAPSIGVLVAARALQGVAGALLVPSSLAVIVNTFPADERGMAIGTWTAWGAIAGVLGPLAGGELLTIASWRWIFVINVPLAAVCVWLILAAIPAGAARERGGRRVDYVGGLLCALGLGGPVFALIEQPRLGWPSAAVQLPLIAGVVLLAAFTWWESRTRDPMLPLVLFRRRNFSAGNVETLAMYAGLSILFFFLVLFLQQIGGYTPLKSGLATLPVTVVMFFLSRRFGALADRYGPRLFMGAGPAAVPDDRRPRGLPLGSAAGPAGLLAGAVADGGAADGGCAGGIGAGGGDRLGREQRDRPRGGAARHGGGGRGDRLVVRLLDERPAGGRRAGRHGARGCAGGKAPAAGAAEPARDAGGAGARDQDGGGGGVAAQLPPGHGHRGGARGAWRRGGGGGDPQPAPRGGDPREQLPGRPAGGGEHGAGKGRAPAGRRVSGEGEARLGRLRGARRLAGPF